MTVLSREKLSKGKVFGSVVGHVRQKGVGLYVKQLARLILVSRLIASTALIGDFALP